MKTVEIQIPEGKKAEWVNGVLTLVDEEVKDNRPVTERIKTFEDACKELGESHELVNQYNSVLSGLVYSNTTENQDADIVAYLKLRIIAAALNEGWKPQFTVSEYRYFPYFFLYTEEGYNDLSDEQKSRVVRRSYSYSHSYGGVAFASANSVSSNMYSDYGSQLAFKTRELAKYAGEQFIDIWADYVFKAR